MIEDDIIYIKKQLAFLEKKIDILILQSPQLCHICKREMKIDAILNEEDTIKIVYTCAYCGVLTKKQEPL